MFNRYIYIYIYVCVHINIYICVCVSTSIHIYIYPHVSTYVYIHLYLSRSIYICLHLSSLNLPTRIYSTSILHLSIYICLCPSVYNLFTINISLSLSISLSLPIHPYIPQSMCVSDPGLTTPLTTRLWRWKTPPDPSSRIRAGQCLKADPTLGSGWNNTLCVFALGSREKQHQRLRRCLEQHNNFTSEAKREIIWIWPTEVGTYLGSCNRNDSGMTVTIHWIQSHTIPSHSEVC